MAEKILIITPVPIVPPHAGNKKRIISICSELKKMGFEIDIFYTGFDKTLNQGHQELINGSILDFTIREDKLKFSLNPILRCKELLNGLKVKLNKIRRYLRDGADSSSYNKSVHEYKNVSKLHLLKKQVENVKYRAVIVNYAVYSFYLDLFSPDVIKIIDIHDCLTNRYKIFLDRGEEPANWYSMPLIDEIRALKKTNVVWAITEGEKNYYQKMLCQTNVTVKTLRHIITFNRIRCQNGDNSYTILLTGSDNKLNIEGYHWFVNKVWPILHTNFPESELIVAGTICNSEEIIREIPGIIFYGKYNQDEEIYKLADICINPMQGGTGLKIKTLEALSYGKRVISTKEGGTGLSDLVGLGLFISDNPTEWISEFNRIFGNKISNDEFIEDLEQQIKLIYSQNINVLKMTLN